MQMLSEDCYEKYIVDVDLNHYSPSTLYPHTCISKCDCYVRTSISNGYTDVIVFLLMYQINVAIV